mmetsp:Transcript_49440/g.128286  ORF Transcript_49440/g.128286 Transcript_49440/m.128286 type:complete len:203 (-) Transcript_49440:225-833(-)
MRAPTGGGGQRCERGVAERHAAPVVHQGLPGGAGRLRLRGLRGEDRRQLAVHVVRREGPEVEVLVVAEGAGQGPLARAVPRGDPVRPSRHGAGRLDPVEGSEDGPAHDRHCDDGGGVLELRGSGDGPPGPDRRAVGGHQHGRQSPGRGSAFGHALHGEWLHERNGGAIQDDLKRRVGSQSAGHAHVRPPEYAQHWPLHRGLE